MALAFSFATTVLLLLYRKMFPNSIFFSCVITCCGGGVGGECNTTTTREECGIYNTERNVHKLFVGFCANERPVDCVRPNNIYGVTRQRRLPSLSSCQCSLEIYLPHERNKGIFVCFDSRNSFFLFFTFVRQQPKGRENMGTTLVVAVNVSEEDYVVYIFISSFYTASIRSLYTGHRHNQR